MCACWVLECSKHLDSLMSKNVELVREALAAFLRGDLDRALEFAHPDVVSFRAPPLPDSQTYHGIDGVLQMYDDWTADFEEFEMQVVELTEVGDRVVVEMVQRGRGKASGVVVEGRFWFVYTLRAGRIARQDVYGDKEQALEST
jgi:ketosteroid isomerase-like protein